jgi:predicted anti-sigma-YlaC factor YlaD
MRAIAQARCTALTGMAVLLAAPLWGCSIKRLAINKVADALVAGGSVYASDDDPELVRDAVPFALKTIEGLLAEVPDHSSLLIAACSGFTQYGFAFVETDAELIEPDDWEEAERLRGRAVSLYLRGRDYCLRDLEARHPGVMQRLMVDPEGSLGDADEQEIDALYWTGASWGAAISLGKDRPELVADLPAVTALMRRVLELREDYGAGAAHEVMIVLESLPANMGGSLERARGHYERAVELSGGRRAGPFVAWATNVAVPAQDREAFERLLGRALDVDPDADPPHRLQNLIVQRRARHLLERAADLFLGGFEEDDTP